jgi:hypothetical protein
MFTYFFSLVIIIFEAICCNLFYDVFCKENSRLRKSQKVLLMLSLICCNYLCGLFLSDMLILKMTLVVLAAVIIMSFYFEIKKNQRIIAGNAQFAGIAAGRGVRFTTGLLLLGKGLGMRETPIRPHSWH